MPITKRGQSIKSKYGQKHSANIIYEMSSMLTKIFYLSLISFNEIGERRVGKECA